MDQTSNAAREGGTCEEYAKVALLSRRRFLGGLAAAGALGITTSVFGDAVRQATFAAAPGGNVMVVISFRGGIDGMGVVVPHADPAYYAARRSIGVPKTSLIAADAQFGMHPKMKDVMWLWESGELAAVHAVGMPAPNRSHFAAMEVVEDADPKSPLRQGWVNRMVGLGSTGSATDAVHLGSATPPTLVEGPSATVATDSLNDIALSSYDGAGWAERRHQQLQLAWADVNGPAGAAARSAITTVRTLGTLAKQPYTSAVPYPREWPGAGLSDALKDTAKLIRADIGTEVVSIDFGTWDFHDDYGRVDSGSMQRMIGAFAASLAAFMKDLGPLRSKVTVVTISEFGRRLAENGNGGLDHGWGNMMLLAGAGVKGGKYYGTWPGLSAGNLLDGDLKVTTDYRQVLGEVVHTRFPTKDVTRVFPDLPYKPLGILSSNS